MAYPPDTLPSFIEQLPQIKTLALYGQLFSGVTEESDDDAMRFVETATDLALTSVGRTFRNLVSDEFYK